MIRTKTNEYDLFLRIDSNTGGHIMWYYFKVSNTTEKGKTIRINICNLRRSKAFYDKVMKFLSSAYNLMCYGKVSGGDKRPTT